MIIGDLLNGIHNIQINEFYNIHMNFLDYHGLKIKINAYLELQDKPDLP